MTEIRDVETRHGTGRLYVDRARRPAATLLLGPGAGGGADAIELAALAAELPRQGVTVVRLEHPWRVAGKRIAPGPSTLDQGLLDLAAGYRSKAPLVVGGRSAGARSACRTAALLGAKGVVALAFPLHPPGRPGRSRLDELTATPVPTLVVQGERDTFGAPDEFPEDVELAVVPGADHSMKVLRNGPVEQSDALGVIVEAVLEFLVHDVIGNQA